jgi:hypothetical protein
VEQLNVLLYFSRDEFLQLSGAVSRQLFLTHIEDIITPFGIQDVTVLPNAGIRVDLTDTLDSTQRQTLRDRVASFAGATLIEKPTVQSVAGPILATNGTLVDVIDFTTPQLTGGTYQVGWTSNLRLTANAANTGARALATINGQTQPTHWDRNLVVAFNGMVTLDRTAGQTIHFQLQVSKVGSGAADAEVTNARCTIDKIG